MNNKFVLKGGSTLEKALEYANAFKGASERGLARKERRKRSKALSKAVESFSASDVDSALMKVISVVGNKSGKKFIAGAGEFVDVKKKDGKIYRSYIATDDKGNWIRLNSDKREDKLNSSDIVSADIWIDSKDKKMLNNAPATVTIMLNGKNVNEIIEGAVSWFKGESTLEGLRESEATTEAATESRKARRSRGLEKATEADTVIEYEGKSEKFSSGGNAVMFLLQKGVADKDIGKYLDISGQVVRNARKKVDGGASEVIPVPDIASIASVTAGVKGGGETINNLVSQYSDVDTIYKDYNKANELLIRDLIKYQDKVEDWLDLPLTQENIKYINKEVEARGTKLLLLTGNPGTGKTFTLEQALENIKFDTSSDSILWDPENPFGYAETPLSESIKAMAKNEDYFVSPKSPSPSLLVDELFIKNGFLYILDDADGVLADKDIKNFLKGALSSTGDTGGGGSTTTYDTTQLVVSVDLQELQEASINMDLNAKERKIAYTTLSIWEDIQSKGWLTDDQWQSIISNEKLYLSHNQMIEIYDDVDYSKVITGMTRKHVKPMTWNYFGVMIIISNNSQAKWLKDPDMSAIMSRAGTVMNISLSPEDMIARILQIYPSVEAKIENPEAKKIARQVYDWLRDDTDTGYKGMLAKTVKSVNTQITVRILGVLVNHAIKSITTNVMDWKEWQGFALRNL